jgi:phosphonate transport system substrate-binding protein
MTLGALRFITYLAPSLPLELFEVVATYAGRKLGVATSLVSDATRSGPEPGVPDPFSLDEADVGFLCAPTLIELSRRDPPPVRLVEAAFAFDDPRAAGRPVYFSDVIVRSDAPARGLADLRGKTWTFNDPSSLSGYWSVLEELTRTGEDRRFFAALERSGSHLESIQRVADGRADAAAIDSNVLRRELSRDPSLAGRVRVMESWGPFPVQPIVVRAGVPEVVQASLRAALLAIGDDVDAGPELRALGVGRMAPTSTRLYEDQASVLERCGAFALWSAAAR